MKHGVLKELRPHAEFLKDRVVWCVYFEGKWRGSYPQRKIAQGHFDQLVWFWGTAEAVAREARDGRKRTAKVKRQP